MAFTQSGPTIRLTVTDAGQRTPVMQGASVCRIWNKGPAFCFIRYGVGQIDADATDLPIPAGLIEVHLKSNALVLAAKCDTGETATLFITPGAGD